MDMTAVLAFVLPPAYPNRLALSTLHHLTSHARHGMNTNILGK
jgi:hypothetical protein